MLAVAFFFFFFFFRMKALHRINVQRCTETRSKQTYSKHDCTLIDQRNRLLICFVAMPWRTVVMSEHMGAREVHTVCLEGP